MRTINVKVTDELKARIVRYAGRRTAERGVTVTVSDVVRQAVEAFLANAPEPAAGRPNHRTRTRSETDE